MNAYLLSAIQSAAYGNQFECSTRDEHSSEIIFGSMRHPNQVGVYDDGDALLMISMLNGEGLKLRFPELATEDGLVIRHRHNDLTDDKVLVGEIFEAAATLPPDANAVLPERTDIHRVVKARLGQHRYKTAQLSDWGNACAVTGIKTPALLRASHAKPWADSNDVERLDPDNGLPLAVHLDALFDAGLISFEIDGSMMLSPALDKSAVRLYGLDSGMRLCHPPTAKQEAYLAYHRDNVFKRTKVVSGEE